MTSPQQPVPDLGETKAAVPPKLNPRVDPLELAAEKNINPRSDNDSFALMSKEIIFDRDQRSESLVSNHGYAMEVTLNADGEAKPRPRVEVLPNWRLSGVIIGNGVLALLDTGARTYEIRPGMTVPGTRWVVKSIDSERAVLVRDGNVLPNEFSVGLQGPIAGSNIGGGAAAGAGAQQPGDQQVGVPGRGGARGGIGGLG